MDYRRRGGCGTVGACPDYCRCRCESRLEAQMGVPAADGGSNGTGRYGRSVYLGAAEQPDALLTGQGSRRRASIRDVSNQASLRQAVKGHTMRAVIVTAQRSPIDSTGAEENSARLDALRVLLAECRGRDVDVVVMPAGYFRTKTRGGFMEEVRRVAENAGVGVCVGVDDVSGKPRAYAWSKRSGWCGPWEQRSCNSSDWKERGMAAQLEQDRDVVVCGEKVAVVICGEVFNRALERVVADKGRRVVVDLVHRGQGFRFHNAARRWSSHPRIHAILMSAHTNCGHGTRRWAVGGKYQGTTRIDVLVNEPIRIEGTIVSV